MTFGVLSNVTKEEKSMEEISQVLATASKVMAVGSLDFYEIKMFLCRRQTARTFATMTGKEKFIFFSNLGVKCFVSAEMSEILLHLVAESLKSEWNEEANLKFLQFFFSLHFTFEEGFDTWRGRKSVHPSNLDFLNYFLKAFASSEAICEGWLRFLVSCYSDQQLELLKFSLGTTAASDPTFKKLVRERIKKDPEIEERRTCYA